MRVGPGKVVVRLGDGRLVRQRDLLRGAHARAGASTRRRGHAAPKGSPHAAAGSHATAGSHAAASPHAAAGSHASRRPPRQRLRGVVVVVVPRVVVSRVFVPLVDGPRRGAAERGVPSVVMILVLVGAMHAVLVGAMHAVLVGALHTVLVGSVDAVLVGALHAVLDGKRGLVGPVRAERCVVTELLLAGETLVAGDDGLVVLVPVGSDGSDSGAWAFGFP